MNNSTLSIILITRNSKSVLFDCLKSLDNNDEITSSKNAEWIIVDNNSDDGSIEEVLKLYPNTKVIKNNDNLGFAKAANQGFNISSNDFILGSSFFKNRVIYGFKNFLIQWCTPMLLY